MKKTRLFAIVISLFLLGSTAVYAAPSKVPAKGLDAALKAHG
jgi:hypothetical protein